MKKPVRTRKQYSLVEKHNVVAAFLTTGNMAEAGEMCGVDRRRVSDWSKTEWWDIAVIDITKMLNQKLISKMRGYALKAYDLMDDRLENGDVGTYKDQEFRHGAKLISLSMSANIAADKVQRSEGSITEKGSANSLQEIAKMFEDLAKVHADRVSQNQMAGSSPIIDGIVVTPALPGDRQ
jgi:hypothetical protein